jgi:hypothetical protein
LTPKIIIIAEQLCSRFNGRLLLVCTGQQALTDTADLQKLLGRFSVQVPLGSADINTVIRRTVLRKKDTAKPAISKMLDDSSGEIHKQLAGTKLAHTAADSEDAVADWPILPTRRRLWERVLRELDRTGLGGTLRGQLRTSLDAVKQYGDKPLGWAVPVDFLYTRFSDEASNRGLLLRETKDRIDLLRAQLGEGPLKARILMVVYLLSRIAGDASYHGVTARTDTIADLLVEDLANAASLRSKIAPALAELQDQGAVIEVSDEWRVQTKESAEWQQDYATARAAEANDANGQGRTRASLLQQAPRPIFFIAECSPRGFQPLSRSMLVVTAVSSKYEVGRIKKALLPNPASARGRLSARFRSAARKLFFMVMPSLRRGHLPECRG